MITQFHFVFLCFLWLLLLVDLKREGFRFGYEFASWGELDVGVDCAGGFHEVAAGHVDASEMIVRGDAVITTHDQGPR